MPTAQQGYHRRRALPTPSRDQPRRDRHKNDHGGGDTARSSHCGAPPDKTVATPVYTATSFLYTGSTPVQTGVSPDTIEAKRAAVIRGKVLDTDNLPLPGVTITILNHPEYGQTITRPDGMFDMAVNGGGYLTVNYSKRAYLPAQRQVNVPWQDYVTAPDVALVQLDTAVTIINLTSPLTIQVARGALKRTATGPGGQLCSSPGNPG